MRTNPIKSEPDQLGSENPTRQQILAYRCRLMSQLADVLAPAAESAAARKAFRLFADELLDVSIKISQPEQEEPEGFTLEELLARLEN
jgi:hypothetical protein